MHQNQENIQEEDELFEHHRIEVDKGQKPLRIDKFLSNRLENTSRNRIQNAALAGSILVNEQSVKSNYKVKPGDVVSIVMAYPPRETEIIPEDIPLDIVYEDDDLLIVNKPAGMVVHPGFNNYNGTLVHALAYHFQNLPTLPGNDGRPGLVHRIDKDTSGLLLISKNEVSMTNLAKQFFDHSIDRTYHALVWGDFEEDEGTLHGYLDRSLKDRRITAVYETPEEGKEAITHYKVLERFSFVTLIECKLETGRTHQIRAQMKHAGHPLFNDDWYGGSSIRKGPKYTKYKQFINNCFDILPRQALHAKTLGFVHPKTGEYIKFDSEYPQDFHDCVEKWRHYLRNVKLS